MMVSNSTSTYWYHLIAYAGVQVQPFFLGDFRGNDDLNSSAKTLDDLIQKNANGQGDDSRTICRRWFCIVNELNHPSTHVLDF